MRTRPQPIRNAVIIMALSSLIASSGCSAARTSPSDDAMNVNGGAERSYTDEQLENHDGSSFFPDTFTFEELMEDYRCTLGEEQDGAFGPGAYLVGTAGAPAPGTYYLEGSQDAVGELNVYTPADEEGKYRFKFGFNYFGFTLMSLDADDAVFFKPPSPSSTMRAADLTTEQKPAEDLYQSGLYRVGIDIPAGTYTVTQSPDNAAAISEKAYITPAAVIYKNLDFDTDNKILEEELPRIDDGQESIQISIEDGQYFELFGCTATPKES